MCNCRDIGKDGTSKHSGEIYTLKWIKNPIDRFDWIGKRLKSCENHLKNYLKTGFFEQV